MQGLELGVDRIRCTVVVFKDWGFGTERERGHECGGPITTNRDHKVEQRRHRLDGLCVCLVSNAPIQGHDEQSEDVLIFQARSKELLGLVVGPCAIFEQHTQPEEEGRFRQEGDGCILFRVLCSSFLLQQGRIVFVKRRSLIGSDEVELIRLSTKVRTRLAAGELDEPLDDAVAFVVLEAQPTEIGLDE